VIAAASAACGQHDEQDESGAGHSTSLRRPVSEGERISTSSPASRSGSGRATFALMVATTAPEVLAASALRRPTWLRRVVIAIVVLSSGVVAYAWSASRPSHSAQPPPRLAYSVAGVVVTEGGPPPSTPGASDVRPDANATVIVIGASANGRHIRRTETTDRHGRFALRLPPGTYTVSGVEFSQLPLSRQPHAIVTVEPGKPVRIRLKGYVF
jgi:hypothetical protein